MDGDRRTEPISPNGSRPEPDQPGPAKKPKHSWQLKFDGRNGFYRTIAEKSQRAGSSSSYNERCPVVQEPQGSTSSMADCNVTSAQVLVEIDANSDTPSVHHRQQVIEVDATCDVAATAVNRQGALVDGPPPPPPPVEGEAEAIIPRTATHSALRRWQSKQMAQAIIDNSINKVLGDLSHSPLIPGWGNYLNPLNIENEGVAEAIRQQGLQRRYSQCPPAAVSIRQAEAARYKRLRMSVEESDGTSTSDCHVDSTGPNVATANTSYPSGEEVDEAESAVLEPETEADHSSNDAAPKDAVSAAAPSDTILMPPEELLDTAISCAITHKGLGVLPVHE